MIRPARPSDHAAVDALFRAVGSDDGPTPERWREQTMPKTLVVEHEGAIVGCVEHHPSGAVRNLIVHADARNRGIGRALMEAAADTMRARGITRWHLVVDADNAAAIRLYSQLGMYSSGHSMQLRIAWTTIATLPAETVGTSRIKPEDIGALERRFGITQLARLASSDVSIGTKLDDYLGFAVFAPARADIRGLRVMRPSLTGALLASFAPHARHPHVDVAIENNDAVCELLERHGASVRLRLFHMSGAL